MRPAAMIFAAGFGTRMRDLTRDLPKPMLPVAGRPLIDHTIEHLLSAGIEKIVANTHYLPDRIAPHLNAQGVAVTHEEDILETGGGLRAALPTLGTDPVITMNPDVVWRGPNPVTSLLNAWRDKMDALLMLVPSPDGLEDDDFSLEQGEIARKGAYRYTGLQLIRADRLHQIGDRAFSLNAYWDLLAEDGALNGVVYDGAWCDVGTPEGLMAAERLLAT